MALVDCALCIDGIVHLRDEKGYETMRACVCPTGEKQHANLMYAPSDKKKERPLHISSVRSKWSTHDFRAAASGDLSQNN